MHHFDKLQSLLTRWFRENAPTGRSTFRHMSVTSLGRSKAGSPLGAWGWLPLVGDCSLDRLVGPRGYPGKLRHPLAMIAMSVERLKGYKGASCNFDAQ